MAASFEPSQVLVMILAGGEGKRLFPLTLDRAKPAVPFGGRYRIIDIVLSNFVNSGLSRIKVLTQYKSASLEEHIARDWRLSPILDQFIEAIPAQQRTGKTWFRGSADAVYQCKHVITDETPGARRASSAATTSTRWTCARCSTFTTRKGADATVAAIPVPRNEASDFGVIEIDDDGRIVALPREGAKTRRRCPATRDMCLASMGNYVFRTDTLMRELDEDAGRRRVDARLRARHPAAHGARRAARSSPTTSRPTSCRARTSTTAATGATSGRSTRTGRRRWISSRSTRSSTSTTCAGRSARA